MFHIVGYLEVPGLVIYNTVQKLALTFIPLVSEVERPDIYSKLMLGVMQLVNIRALH